jgi:mono/diheme cytochrome c family protein/plastocyanin
MMTNKRIAASLFLLGLLALTAVALWFVWPRSTLVEASRPEVGGWTPDVLQAQVGEPLKLRFTASDMMHGFAVGQTEWKPIDIPPGETVVVELVFDEPGVYTFYCTRFCSRDHWRMRGTIEVTGDALAQREPVSPPLYVTLGLDIDAPHEIDPPAKRPSAARGATIELQTAVVGEETYKTQSPAQVWQELRQNPETDALTDMELWDLIAWTWQNQSEPASLELGKTLYQANCLSCHGPKGTGDGPIAVDQPTAVPDFTDLSQMPGASSALLHGKIIRGGMGTGMPNWGNIFTEDEIWALIDYLWTFPFSTEVEETS